VQTMDVPASFQVQGERPLISFQSCQQCAILTSSKRRLQTNQGCPPEVIYQALT
jgi:hypothetical protein